MPHTVRVSAGLVLLVVIPSVLAFLWGLSWAAGDFPECGRGTYFLADLGWSLGGMLLGFAVGVTVPIVLAISHRFVLVLPILGATGLGMFLAADVGAASAADIAGCSVWGDIADAGEMTVFGVAIGAVPITLIVGTVVGIAWLRRPRSRP